MKNRGRFVKYLQVERNVPLKRNRFKLAWFCIKFGVFLMILGYAVYGAWSFFNNFTFRSPIIIQSPIVPNKVELIISPVASDSAKLKLINVGEIADRYLRLKVPMAGMSCAPKELIMDMDFGRTLLNGYAILLKMKYEC